MKIPERFIEQKTIKMTAVVFMCIAFYTVFKSQDSASLMMISSGTAVFGVKSSSVDSWIFARYRLWGTAIGCSAGTAYLLLQNHLNNTNLLRLILIPLATYFTIVASGGNKSPITVRGALMTMITMTLLAPVNDSNYVLQRILATFVGGLMVVLVNLLFAPKKAHIIKGLKESIEVEKKEKKKQKQDNLF